MAFIRVQDQASGNDFDLNVKNIVAFGNAVDENNNPTSGSFISLVGGGTYHVSNTVRQLRGFVRVAEGNTPETSAKGK